MDNRCSFCDQVPQFTCDCGKAFIIRVCLTHKDSHSKTIGVHNFTPYVPPPRVNPPAPVVVNVPVQAPVPPPKVVNPPPVVKPLSTFSLPNFNYILNNEPVPQGSRKVNEATKTKLLNKIIAIRNETNEEKAKAIEYGSKAIEEINKQIKNVIKNLDGFIELCESVILEISKIVSIKNLNLRGPLESLLISDNIESILKNLTPPKVEAVGIYNIFSYIASTFPHEIYNYSQFAVGFESINTLKGYPIKEKVTNNLLSATSSILCVGSDKVLVTGGYVNNALTGNSFLLNLKTQATENLPALKVPRQSHAMGWLDGNLMVIGGQTAQGPIAEVEILKENNEWVLSNGKLNHARKDLSVIALHKSLWVVGGEGPSGFEKTIEKCEKTNDREYRWNDIIVTLMTPLSKVWLLASGNDILIVGGKTTESEEAEKITSKIHIFINQGTDIQKIDNLDDADFFIVNQVFINEKKVYAISSTGKVIEIDLTRVYR